MRLLHFLNWTTSKTKQFCETSFKNGKLSAELTASYHCVLRFLQSTCRKYRACHEKVMPGHTKCCTCHGKSSQQTCTSDAPKCNPSQKISALASSSDEDVSCTAPATENASLQILFKNVPRLPSFLDMPQNPHFFAHFEKVHNPLRLPHKTTPERPKVARTCGVLYILTSKFAWCHNGVHFFDISTYKVVRAWCVLHILTSKCASRHNGVHFSRHRNFQKWSEPGAFCTF